MSSSLEERTEIDMGALAMLPTINRFFYQLILCYRLLFKSAQKMSYYAMLLCSKIHFIMLPAINHYATYYYYGMQLCHIM